MDNFERLTQSRDALGAFLRSLPILTAPWDNEFHLRVCANCAAENCTDCDRPERNNPDWWLGLDSETPPAVKK